MAIKKTLESLFLAGVTAGITTLATARDVKANLIDWIYNPKTKHQYSQTSPGTWPEVSAEAQARSGYLTAIGNAEENQWLIDNFNGKDKGGKQHFDLWIGFTDDDKEGTFKWTNNEPVNFTNWHIGEPNNQFQPHWNDDEDYATIRVKASASLGRTPGFWVDNSGYTVVPGIVERVPEPPTITNGAFESNVNDWERYPQNTVIWHPEVGPDNQSGALWINGYIGQVPWAQQLITGLIPNQEYEINGFFKSFVDWHEGPSFQAKIDDNVLFQGGHTRIDNWTQFSFPFTATDTDALLRFESQIGSDSDYIVDQVSIIPEPSTLALLGLGATFLYPLRKRKSN